ncbi:MAG: phosphoribosylformylglycinamidine cyclo-ligase [Anaerorhabdus sp.]
MSKLYKESGVNLEAGYKSVELIKKHVSRTKTLGSYDSIGSFGGMFDLNVLKIKEPILVSGCDGVGTKLLIAIDYDLHDTIGIDAVAMCANDVLVQGAMPLFFLDYIATQKNNPKVIESIVKGVADGCIMANCALIGGETAEMSDMYQENHYDIAGFCVGAVDKSKLIDGSKVKEDDVLIGLSSSGLHSNGFSLVRKILLKDNKLDLFTKYDNFDEELGKVLLTPTKIYVKAIKHLFENNIEINGMSHITGGGFYENLPRMLHSNLGAEIDLKSFNTPEIFKLLQNRANISDAEMYNVFNMGIGFVMAVDKKDKDNVLKLLKEINESAYEIGKVVNKSGVHFL